MEGECSTASSHMRTLDAVSRPSPSGYLGAGHTDGSRAQVQLSAPMSQPSFLERIAHGVR